jgi:hypothetical protein
LIIYIEAILVFVEKTGSRFNIRNRVDEILFRYLSEVQLLLSLLAKTKLLKNLHINLMKILGYFFYIFIFIL